MELLELSRHARNIGPIVVIAKADVEVASGHSAWRVCVDHHNALQLAG